MADIIGLLGTAVDSVRKLKEVADKLKNAELRNSIGDLSLALADLKLEVARLKEENLRLQGEMQQAKNREQQAGELIAKDGVLWFKEPPPPGKTVGPYCPNCKENGNKLVLIQDQRRTPFRRLYHFECPLCQSKFGP